MTQVETDDIFVRQNGLQNKYLGKFSNSQRM